MLGGGSFARQKLYDLLDTQKISTDGKMPKEVADIIISM